MEIIVSTTRGIRPSDQPIKGWLDKAAHGHHKVRVCDNPGFGPVRTYQEAFEASAGPILGFLHDDLEIDEAGWDARVERQFAELDVAVVGFGGATRHGAHDIYSSDYELTQLGRLGYASNARDAEVHGARFAGDRDVATIDGYAIFVRRSFLEEVGGWPVSPMAYGRNAPGGLIFHCYDYWITLMARRHRKRIRMCGVACLHRGGGKGDAWGGWLRSNLGIADSDVHRDSHRWIYDEFRDVLPVNVEKRAAA